MTRPVPLSGGRQTSNIVRDGDTVRRPRPVRADAIVLLLRELRDAGFEGVPRVVDPDDHGDLVLEWIPGRAIVTSPFRLDEAQARSAARLVRAFHDASTRTTMGRGAEVVAHGDLGPHNLVFRGDEAVAIIDWDDGVGPGRRAVDFADAVWGCADIIDQLVPVERQRMLLEAMCDEYGLVAPATVLDELDAQFERARRTHHAAGRAEPARIFADMRRQLADTRPRLLGR